MDLFLDGVVQLRQHDPGQLAIFALWIFGLLVLTGLAWWHRADGFAPTAYFLGVMELLSVFVVVDEIGLASRRLRAEDARHQFTRRVVREVEASLAKSSGEPRGQRVPYQIAYT